MNYNPYTPPSSDVSQLRAQAVPRPFAVWFLIVFLVVFIATFLFGTGRFVLFLSSHFNEIQSSAAITLALGVSWRLAIIAAFSVTTVSVYRRKPWSRWLGIACIICLAATPFLVPHATQYTNDAQKAGANFARFLLFPLLFAWWGYAFGFSSKARRYFTNNPAS